MFHNFLTSIARSLYRRKASINVYPVSRGTWTVRARVDGKHKDFHGLSSDSAIVDAFYSAQTWIIHQSTA